MSDYREGSIISDLQKKSWNSTSSPAAQNAAKQCMTTINKNPSGTTPDL